MYLVVFGIKRSETHLSSGMWYGCVYLPEMHFMLLLFVLSEEKRTIFRGLVGLWKRLTRPSRALSGLRRGKGGSRRSDGS